MDKQKVKSAIALGSNLGDSLEILVNAVKKIAQKDEIEVISCSTWHKTKPIGPPQPDYFNGCIIINTFFSPDELLEYLFYVEGEFGRERKERWGARTLDLDLILYDNLIINSENLQIPHPRMRERMFVLMPLAEIAPYWVDPISKLKIIDLLQKLIPDESVNT